MLSNLAIGIALLRFGVAGLAATLSISSFLQTGLLMLLLRRKIGPLGIEKLLRPASWQVLLSAPAVAAAYENGTGLNVAAHGEIDDVIDPADTRRWITTLTREVAGTPRSAGRVRPHVDTW